MTDLLDSMIKIEKNGPDIGKAIENCVVVYGSVLVGMKIDMFLVCERWKYFCWAFNDFEQCILFGWDKD